MNGLTNLHKNWYDAMPHITEHTPKVSTLSVYPCARESLRKRIQQDRETHTHSHRLSKTTFLDVLKVVHPKSGLISSLNLFPEIFVNPPSPPPSLRVIIESSLQQRGCRRSVFTFFSSRQLAVVDNISWSFHIDRKNIRLLVVPLHP